MKPRVATSPFPSSLDTCGWNKSPAELIYGSTAVCVARICGNIVIMFSVLRPSSSSSSQPAQESSTPFLTAILPGVSRAARTGLGCTPRKLFSVSGRHRGPCSATISCRNACSIAWSDGLGCPRKLFSVPEVHQSRTRRALLTPTSSLGQARAQEEASMTSTRTPSTDPGRTTIYFR